VYRIKIPKKRTRLNKRAVEPLTIIIGISCGDQTLIVYTMQKTTELWPLMPAIKRIQQYSGNVVLMSKVYSDSTNIHFMPIVYSHFLLSLEGHNV
jgi:hypothetical protein